ncbi:MAG TPA: SatD family protein [Pseudolysinimonas sp.]
MDNDLTGAAVIGDVIGSRWRDPAEDWHGILVAALDRVNAQVDATQPLAPTVGDEFQAMYPTLGAAVRATMLVRLELDSKLDCRFGIGVGSSAEVGRGALPIQAGTAWWAARDAIVTVKSHESGRHPSLRTWCATASSDDGPMNAYLLARDHLITSMDARSRRLLLGTIQSRTQSELARSEGIGQSAVSRSLRRNGAYAVADGAALIESKGEP